MSGSSRVLVRIRRQDDPKGDPYWEDFEVTVERGMSIVSVLLEIQRNPVNRRGMAVSPVVWEGSCLEGSCGSCSLLVNKRPEIACLIPLESQKNPIVLEPLSKFPVIRDLVVDFSRPSRDLGKIHGGNKLPHSVSSFQEGDDRNQEQVKALSRCTHCHICLEVCPQYHGRSSFVGASIVAQVHLSNLTTSLKSQREKRLEMLMGEGGVDDCGHAQNCQRACPSDVPLLTSIARMQREVTMHALGKIFGV